MSVDSVVDAVHAAGEVGSQSPNLRMKQPPQGDADSNDQRWSDVLLNRGRPPLNMPRDLPQIYCDRKPLQPVAAVLALGRK